MTWTTCCGCTSSSAPPCGTGAARALGVVASVEANPASDLMVLESGGLIPVRFVTAHDAAARTVDVDIPEGLLDL